LLQRDSCRGGRGQLSGHLWQPSAGLFPALRDQLLACGRPQPTARGPILPQEDGDSCPRLAARRHRVDSDSPRTRDGALEVTFGGMNIGFWRGILKHDEPHAAVGRESLGFARLILQRSLRRNASTRSPLAHRGAMFPVLAIGWAETIPPSIASFSRATFEPPLGSDSSGRPLPSRDDYRGGHENAEEHDDPRRHLKRLFVFLIEVPDEARCGVESFALVLRHSSRPFSLAHVYL